MKIKHVNGNVLRLDIPLTVKIVTSEGGHTQETEEPFYPDTSRPVLVELANKYNITKYTYEATMTENVAHIEDRGDIKVGIYKVTVKCFDEQGQPYRYMARDIIDIVDATADAGIEAGIEFDSETYTLEGAYFIKGEKGDKGDKGDTGEGVAAGGTTGQVLQKKSNADYDTEWVNPPASGVSSVNGKTGEVTLDAEDVGALPADTPIPTEQIQSDWNQSDNTKKDFIKNKPSIPSALADLSEDTTHRTVTDSEKGTWNGKQDAINDLSEIRSGAAAGATAYQKPLNGIPANDIAPNVIPDVSNFITKSVDDLVNYYLKSETYTKTEVQTLINAVKQFTYEVVQTLPTATVDTMHKIYLVPSSDPQTQNVKDEYITIDNGSGAQTRYTWEQIGSTAIDLSGYVTTTALNTALANYVLSSDLHALTNNEIDTIWNNVMS